MFNTHLVPFNQTNILTEKQYNLSPLTSGASEDRSTLVLFKTPVTNKLNLQHGWPFVKMCASEQPKRVGGIENSTFGKPLFLTQHMKVKGAKLYIIEIFDV